MKELNLTEGPILKNLILFSEDYGATRMEKLKEDTGYSFWFIAAVTVVLDSDWMVSGGWGWIVFLHR